MGLGREGRGGEGCNYLELPIDVNIGLIFVKDIGLVLAVFLSSFRFANWE